MFNLIFILNKSISLWQLPTQDGCCEKKLTWKITILVSTDLQNIETPCSHMPRYNHAEFQNDFMHVYH